MPAPSPTTPSEHGASEWVKKQLKTPAGWLKALDGKVAAALPGIIGAIVSWLLKTIPTPIAATVRNFLLSSWIAPMVLLEVCGWPSGVTSMAGLLCR